MLCQALSCLLVAMAITPKMVNDRPDDNELEARDGMGINRVMRVVVWGSLSFNANTQSVPASLVFYPRPPCHELVLPTQTQ